MRLKRLTQSVTGILVGAIVIMTGYLMGKVFYLVGFTSSVDSLWDGAKIPFWWAFFISRLIFVAVWGFGDYLIVHRLHMEEWFWFEPGRTSYYEEKRDKSGEIIGAIVAILFVVIMATMMAEITIRISSWTLPPFWL